MYRIRCLLTSADLNAPRNITQVGISCLSRFSINKPNIKTG